ncbi:hypothetical protein PSPO01_05255 [Paraphaeosphaeria sporulosa]
MNPTYTSRVDSQGRSFTCAIFDFGTEDLRAVSSRRGSIASLAEDDPIKDWDLYSQLSEPEERYEPSKIPSEKRGRISGTVSPQPLPTPPQPLLTQQAEALPVPLPPLPGAEILARLNARPDLVYYLNRPGLCSREFIDQPRQPIINFRDPKRSYRDSAGLLNEILQTNDSVRTDGLLLPGISKEQEEKLGTENNAMDTLLAPLRAIL